jgi:hypothetical protein
VGRQTNHFTPTNSKDLVSDTRSQSPFWNPMLFGLTVHTCRPGDWPDVEVFRDGLIHALVQFERAEADDGYIGVCPGHTKCPGHISSEKRRERMQMRTRLRHETINERFKNWRCLEERFRHGIEKHSSCFRAIAVLTQLAIESGESLFDAREYDDDLTDDDVRNVLGL